MVVLGSSPQSRIMTTVVGRRRVVVVGGFCYYPMYGSRKKGEEQQKIDATAQVSSIPHAQRCLRLVSSPLTPLLPLGRASFLLAAARIIHHR